METVWTIPEIAKHLKMSKAKLYYLAQRKQLPHIRLGRNIRVLDSQLNEWLQKLAVKC
jgi:excisionase family DNA binding protein